MISFCASRVPNWHPIYSVASTEEFADSDVNCVPFAAAAELTVKKILPKSPDANVSTSPPSFFLCPCPQRKARKR